MSVVKVNAMQIHEGAGDDFLSQFAKRPHKIEHVDGFESFQVLRPSDDRNTWLVITQWRDEDAFNAWYGGRPPRDPANAKYADGYELWSFDVLETVFPAEA